MFFQHAEIYQQIAFQELSWDGLRWCLKAITQKELCTNHKIICKAHRKTVASDVPSVLTHIYQAWEFCFFHDELHMPLFGFLFACWTHPLFLCLPCFPLKITVCVLTI